MIARLLLIAALFASACTSVRSPATPSPVLVDTLDYIIGDPAMWPRVGNQWQQQTLDYTKNEVCWIKYANPRRFECWRWDDQWIVHHVDNAVDGDTGESYEFSDGRWMPRYVSGAWSLDVRDNAVRWFNRDCTVNPAKSGPAPYRVSLSFEPPHDIGGDLGVRAVMVLTYVPSPDRAPDIVEHFYFARGAGWYAWDNGRVTVRFDTMNHGTLRQRAAACGE